VEPSLTELFASFSTPDRHRHVTLQIQTYFLLLVFPRNMPLDLKLAPST
jgi:hypothetical protein